MASADDADADADADAEGRGGMAEVVAHGVVVRTEAGLGSDGTDWRRSVTALWINEDEALGVKGVVMKAEDDFMVVLSGSNTMVSLGKLAFGGPSHQPPEE